MDYIYRKLIRTDGKQIYDLKYGLRNVLEPTLDDAMACQHSELENLRCTTVLSLLKENIVVDGLMECAKLIFPIQNADIFNIV